MLRRFAKEAEKKNKEYERKSSMLSATRSSSYRKVKEARPAVRAQPSDRNFSKTVIPKSDQVRNLIYHSIKQNILFRTCSEEELQDLIDCFDKAEFKADTVVIKQGDEGDLFYVVESGELDISMLGSDDGCSPREYNVGVPYMTGSSFGELALMYGSPRAATICTRSDCVLWSLDRNAFKGVTGSHKQKRDNMILDCIRKVKLGGSILGDVLHPSDIDAMALAVETDTFEKGTVIVRQGERGDAFYIIQSGSVDVFTRENGVKPVASLEQGHFFGERALISEDVRQATCIATSDVKCLTLTREDFVRMLGNLQDLIDDDKRISSATNKEGSDEEVRAPLPPRHLYQLEDLEIKRTLGMGAFGRVKLVKVKPEKVAKGDDPIQTYALKCLSKRSIVDNGLKEHVINEKNIMSELNHPFIISYYGAMQDDKNVYFLLEILLGGELFATLRTEGQFPESWSRFYAASVVLAYEQIHAKKIAYRDLKPENLVMDAEGFLKIVDFGLAKKIGSGKSWTLCGTPDYLAPEVILSEGHDWAVDYWALGVLIYEMTHGSAPFYADDPMTVYEKILSGHVNIPIHFSRSLADFVKKLLKTTQAKRLGRTKGGVNSVLKHKWFAGFDWNALLSREFDVPLRPRVESLEDASNFDEYPDEPVTKEVSFLVCCSIS